MVVDDDDDDDEEDDGEYFFKSKLRERSMANEQPEASILSSVG